MKIEKIPVNQIHLSDRLIVMSDKTPLIVRKNLNLSDPVKYVILQTPKISEIPCVVIDKGEISGPLDNFTIKCNNCGQSSFINMHESVINMVCPACNIIEECVQ